jgi:hypothetical protein
MAYSNTSTPLMGSMLVIKVDSSILGCVTDFDFKINNKVIEIKYMDSIVSQFMGDGYDWGVTTNGIMPRVKDTSVGYTYIINMIDKALVNDSSVLLSIYPTTNVSVNYYEGVALVVNPGFSGGVGDAIKTSLEFKGIAALTKKST